VRARHFLPVAALLGVLAAVLLPAGVASAHPLGNFSVNQLDALGLYPDRIDVAATVDIAELPTLQERSTVDTNGDGTVSDDERAAYARSTCGTLAGDLVASAGGHRLMWTVEDGATFGYAAGAAGLSTSRLDCRLTAPAALQSASTVDVTNGYRSDRIGWREMTAVGHGVGLVDSPLPSTSVSDGLRAYPQDLLTSPLNVRSAHLTTVPGPSSASGAAAGSAAAAAPVRSPGGLTGWSLRTERSLQGLVGGRHLTPLVGVLAVLLAIVLGAGHAALPGHGKTVMAVYLTGQAGRVRDALGVAATVTLTHTGGVLVLGLLLTSIGSLAGETALGWLGVVSGVTVAAVGLGMLFSARRRASGHAHSHDRSHPHPHPHSHGHGHSHTHSHPEGGAEGGAAGGVGGRPSRLSIVGMGVAGGLVPSPSALVILLGAIGLGRTAFGILLVVGYGLGMAATLTAAGFALVLLRRRWAARLTPSGTRWARLSRFAPTGTAALVLLVGIGLAGRALLAVA
jgi:nickel/cobalt transporter (NicO) family protein